MTDMGKVIYDVSTLTDYDIYLFKQGNNFRLHEKLGAHLRNVKGFDGTHFAVWAPNAQSVFVVGDLAAYFSRDKQPLPGVDDTARGRGQPQHGSRRSLDERAAVAG